MTNRNLKFFKWSVLGYLSFKFHLHKSYYLLLQIIIIIICERLHQLGCAHPSEYSFPTFDVKLVFTWVITSPSWLQSHLISFFSFPMCEVSESVLVTSGTPTRKIPKYSKSDDFGGHRSLQNVKLSFLKIYYALNANMLCSTVYYFIANEMAPNSKENDRCIAALPPLQAYYHPFKNVRFLSDTCIYHKNMV